MIDNTPPVIPKESTSFLGTILSIAFHALLVGAIWWMSTNHDVIKQAPISNVRASADIKAGTMQKSEGSAGDSPIVESAKNDISPDASTGKAVQVSEKNKSTATDAAENRATSVILPIVHQMHSKQSVALTDNRKAKMEKLKKRKHETALAQQKAKQKSVMIALKKKEAAQQADLLEKKRAAEIALKMATEAQKRKELDDQRIAEKLHREEMQRITNSVTARG